MRPILSERGDAVKLQQRQRESDPNPIQFNWSSQGEFMPGRTFIRLSQFVR